MNFNSVLNFILFSICIGLFCNKIELNCMWENIQEQILLNKTETNIDLNVDLKMLDYKSDMEKDLRTVDVLITKGDI